MRTKVTIIAAALLTALAINGAARRQSTISRGLKAAAETTVIDTITSMTVIEPDTSAITIAGYDKPVDSRTESFFIVNRSAHRLKGISIILTYFDTSGRQLHQATHNIYCDIPAGNTRQTTVPSWDRQQSFYYILSRAPRRKSTPFTVTCRIMSATITDDTRP